MLDHQGRGLAMRVLVVDDDNDFCLLSRRALEARGHEVETLGTAFGLVNRVAGAVGPPPDVVILDCDLPGLSGLSAIELLARDRRTSQVPVLLTSVADSEQHRAAARTHPLGSFHQKNGHMKKLVDALEEHVGAAALSVVTRR